MNTIITLALFFHACVGALLLGTAFLLSIG